MVVAGGFGGCRQVIPAGSRSRSSVVRLDLTVCGRIGWGRIWLRRWDESARIPWRDGFFRRARASAEKVVEEAARTGPGDSNAFGRRIGLGERALPAAHGCNHNPHQQQGQRLRETTRSWKRRRGASVCGAKKHERLESVRDGGMGTAWTRTVNGLLGSSTARDACGRMAPQTSTTYGWSIDQEGL